MKLREHILISAAASAGIYKLTESFKISGVSFLAGVLLDVDHLYDYWKSHSFNLNLAKFFNTCHECDFHKTRLYLHSFELVVILAVVSYFTRSGLAAALTLGMSQHLALDQFFNNVYPASYLFIYRWLNDFKVEMVFSNLSLKGK